jgi:hypothetical protein
MNKKHKNIEIVWKKRKLCFLHYEKSFFSAFTLSFGALPLSIMPIPHQRKFFMTRLQTQVHTHTHTHKERRSNGINKIYKTNIIILHKILRQIMASNIFIRSSFEEKNFYPAKLEFIPKTWICTQGYA